MPITEIIQTTRLSQSKIYVPKRVRDKLKIKDGDKIVWCLNKYGELIVRNSKEPLPSSTVISY